MQDCPHCGEKIQDEAIFCRYCRRDVDPPMWLASMQKCPYCAEWIERGLDSCPLCEKELVEKATTKVPPFTQRPQPDFATDFRQRVGFVEGPQEKPPTEPKPTRQPSPSAEETVRVPPFTPQADYEEGAPTLLRGILDDQEVADGLTGIQTSRVEKGKIRVDLGSLFRRILPIVFTLLIIVAVVLLVMGPGKEVGETVKGFFLQIIAKTPTITSTPPPVFTVTVGPTHSPIPPQQSDTPQATIVPTEISGCVLWEQVSLADEGAVMCVYGVIRRWFASGDIPFVVLFSEEEGTFVFVDYYQVFTEAKPGVCIVAQGEIEVMRGTRPFIDLGGTIEICPEDLNETP